ncbi:MAG: hypothetical protein QMD36_00260 [Candidatus Aenigmarchaeota archaeon]|nr:hypothetical protein [Candidatus Aenigmarchaeota archaeon]
MTKVDLKKVGIILIVISIALFFVLYMINSLIIKLRLELDEYCLYKGSVPTEMLGAYVIDTIIGIGSIINNNIYLFRKNDHERKNEYI